MARLQNWDRVVAFPIRRRRSNLVRVRVRHRYTGRDYRRAGGIFYVSNDGT